MKYLLLFKGSFAYRVAGLVTACSLLFSLGLHSVQVEHIHPSHHEHGNAGEHGATTMSEIAEYAHAAEKKMFLLLGASVLVLVPSLLVRTRWNEFVRYDVTVKLIRSTEHRIQNLRLYSDEYHMLATGKLNPKTY